MACIESVEVSNEHDIQKLIERSGWRRALYRDLGSLKEGAEKLLGDGRYDDVIKKILEKSLEDESEGIVTVCLTTGGINSESPEGYFFTLCSNIRQKFRGRTVLTCKIYEIGTSNIKGVIAIY